MHPQTPIKNQYNPAYILSPETNHNNTIARKKKPTLAHAPPTYVHIQKSPRVVDALPLYTTHLPLADRRDPEEARRR